jgi:hypothetical protein
MKSRVTTYILATAVLAVWGFVAWKIFFARPASPDDAPHRPALRETVAPEEYSLRLDYEDPFLKDVRVGGTSVAEGRTQVWRPSDPPIPPQPMPMPSDDLPFKYAGTISTGGRISYMFEREGLLHPLSMGETLDGYTLTATFSDSVRVAKDGMIFTLQIYR